MNDVLVVGLKRKKFDPAERGHYLTCNNDFLSRTSTPSYLLPHDILHCHHYFSNTLETLSLLLRQHLHTLETLSLLLWQQHLHLLSVTSTILLKLFVSHFDDSHKLAFYLLTLLTLFFSSLISRVLLPLILGDALYSSFVPSFVPRRLFSMHLFGLFSHLDFILFRIFILFCALVSHLSS